MGAARDLSEPQAFKNVSLQMMIDQTFTLRRIFLKKYPIQVFTFDMNDQSGSGTLSRLPAFAKICRFHIPVWNMRFKEPNRTQR